jgi:DNA-binding beta-propeller fold protein YncE
VRNQLVALLLGGSALLVVTAAALALSGDIAQPAGTAGCISETGAGPCADGHGLRRSRGVAISPDGKSVYAASLARGTGSGVARLNRNPTTGAITQPAGTAGCISENGAGPCVVGRALSAAQSVAVSPDNRDVYVTSYQGVAHFARDPSAGALSQPAGTAGCISETGSEPCADGHALEYASGIAVSPDGKSVYVASGFWSSVVRLARNTTTGALSQPAGAAGCISDTGFGGCADGHALWEPVSVAVSPDGKSVYAGVSNTEGSASHGAIVRLNRNTATGAISQPAGTAGCISGPGAGGACANGHAVSFPLYLATSPDNKSVYVGARGSDAVARLTRNPTTGAISQPAGPAGCISETGVGPCANGHALTGPYGVAISPDGKSVYAASEGSQAVVRLNRNPTSGAISQPSGAAGCISETGAGLCANGHGMFQTWEIVVSPNGKNLYATTSDSDSVIRLSRTP